MLKPDSLTKLTNMSADIFFNLVTWQARLSGRGTPVLTILRSRTHGNAYDRIYETSKTAPVRAGRKPRFLEIINISAQGGKAEIFINLVHPVNRTRFCAFQGDST